MTEVPPLDFAALLNTAINGKFVGVFNTASVSPRQNKVAVSIEKPRTTLIPTDAIMLEGITFEACWISSAICV